MWLYLSCTAVFLQLEGGGFDSTLGTVFNCSLLWAVWRPLSPISCIFSLKFYDTSPPADGALVNRLNCSFCGFFPAMQMVLCSIPSLGHAVKVVCGRNCCCSFWRWNSDWTTDAWLRGGEWTSPQSDSSPPQVQFLWRHHSETWCLQYYDIKRLFVGCVECL